MKSTIKGLLAAASLTLVSLASAQNIRVTVNEDPVGFEGTQPMSIGGRVFVPLRGVFEMMGAFVEWNPATQTVTAHRGTSNVRLQIGSSSATVDGMQTMMDAPARLISGRTMVPLRFLSESLGASVEWIAPTRTVAIHTSAVINPSRNNPPITTTETVLEDGTVIPVILNDTLSSNGSRVGDRFWVTVNNNGSGYAGLPVGTRIEGRVATASPRSGNNPGMLDLDFRRIMLPDGRNIAIDGSLIGLDNKSVTRNEEGVWVARSDKRDQRVVFAGYGAGAGLLVGLLTKRPLEGALLGGVLGYLFGEIDRQNQRPADVQLKSGTEFGVRLDRDLILRAG